MSYFKQYEKIKEIRKALQINSVWQWSSTSYNSADKRKYRILRFNDSVISRFDLDSMRGITYAMYSSRGEFIREQCTSVNRFMNLIENGSLEKTTYELLF